MQKRGNLVIKIISAILFLAMLCYIGFRLVEPYLSGSAGQRQVLAVQQTVNESCSGEGLMIREEQIVTGGGALCRAVAEDGSKVGAFQPIAAMYADAAALNASRELESLQQQRERLLTLLAYEQAGNDAETARETVRDGVFRLSAALNSARPEDLDLLCDELRAMVVTSAGEGYARTLQEVEAEIARLQNSAASEVSYIYAPVSGLFSENCDGLENLAPDILADLDIARFEELMAVEESSLTAVGKLISGQRWYFAMTVPEKYGEMTYAGDTLSLRLPRVLEKELDVRVERIGSPRAGKCLIILSADRELAALSDVRRASAELIFSSVTGIRVPREAARVDEDGVTYVYILVGIQAQRKNMEIIAETEDYYLVAYTPEDSQSLREGNEILVNYTDLYEGKVVE